MKLPTKYPRTLTFDIENAPRTVRVWGWYEETALEEIEPSYILMVGYKWLDEKRAYVKSLPDYKTFKKNVRDDSEMIRDVWHLLNAAEVVITQNGDNFDIKKLNTRFLQLGLPPPSPYKSVDTKKTSKRHFMFPNNKLDMLGQSLNLGGKMKHEGYDLWKKCMEGDVRAFKRMAAYCKRDVELTEKVYIHERPWINNHPNVNAYMAQEGCPACGSMNIQWRGEQVKKTGRVHRFQCQDCGKWSTDNKTHRTTYRV